MILIVTTQYKQIVTTYNQVSNFVCFKLNLKENHLMSLKQKKPQISVDSIKQVVKKFKNLGFQKLSHWDLALALVTIGFKQVSNEFGAKWTPQHDKEALKTLSKSQYDINWYGKVNNPRFSQLLPLILRGDIEKIKDVIRTTSKQSKTELLSTVDNFKRSALHLAVKEDFDVLTEFLINEGFALNARDRELKTPLHYCRSEMMCQILCKKGAKVVVKDNKLCTPVHYAAQLEDPKVIEVMLKKSNVVNQCDSFMKTPIFYAVFNTSQEQINILRILIQNGAKLNEKDADGRTPLHYAAQSGKSRCIPFLLQKGASIDIRDKHNKTPLDLACNEKIKKILLAYTESKGIILEPEQNQKRSEYSRIQNSNSKKDEKSTFRQKQNVNSSFEKTNTQIFTKQLNQVSTWVREKFFVLMKKLQQSGVKANWHMKRPYIYTGSWAEDIESLEDLYETFLNVSGPQAAMRAFNILCPFEKPLPKVVGKAQEAFQSFFGQNWFSNDPIQKVRNMHSQSKVRTELQVKTKQAEDLNTQLLGYRTEMQNLESQIAELQSQLRRYEKIQEDLRRQRTKNTQQYSQLLQLMGEKQELNVEIESLINGEQKTQILSDMVEQLKQKNRSYETEIESMKAREAAARRKCGQVFLKSLSQAQAGEAQFKVEENNLFDDDAIINLYQLLKQNPPNLEKRFRKSDKKGKGKLTVEQFTQVLQQMSMLPQDVMSMHRITSFAYGRKVLSFEEFKTILETRHKNRPMWEKKLIKKIKDIITSSSVSLEKFFSVIDKDGNGTIQAQQLRKGLQSYNIFMNHTDWCNLFNLLDSDKSGEIDLDELKTLMSQEKSGKLENISGLQNVVEDKDNKEEGQDKDKEENGDEDVDRQDKEDQQDKEDDEGKQEQGKENNQNENDNQNQEDNAPQQEMNNQDDQKQSYQSREQIGRDILEDSGDKFSQPYSEKDSDIEKGIEKINGKVKLQLPKVTFPEGQVQQMKKIFVRFTLDDKEQVKFVDLTKEKQAIAVQFELIEYKLQDREEFNLYLSLWRSRDFDEENYLGERKICLGPLLDDPDKWAVNKKFQLEALEFENAEIPRRVVAVQAKWIPAEQ